MKTTKMFVIGLIALIAGTGGLAFLLGQEANAGGKGGGGKKPPAPAPPGVIYFNNQGTGTTWSMKADGSDKQQVLDWQSHDVTHGGAPHWFLVSREWLAGSEYELFATDGNQWVQLTADPSTYKSLPRWSPDGDYVAFGFIRRFTEPTEYGIAAGRVREADGTFIDCSSIYTGCPTFTDVVFDPDDLSGPGYVSWSPDGGSLAYIRHPEADEWGRAIAWDLYVVEVGFDIWGDVSGPLNSPVNVTNSPELYKQNSDWSACLDGQCNTRIAFTMSPPGTTSRRNIHTIKPDGTDLRQVTSSKSTINNTTPHYSPDGVHIAYMRWKTGVFKYNIFRIEADGSGKAVNLTGDLAEQGVSLISLVAWR